MTLQERFIDTPVIYPSKQSNTSTHIVLLNDAFHRVPRFSLTNNPRFQIRNSPRYFTQRGGDITDPFLLLYQPAHVNQPES